MKIPSEFSFVPQGFDRSLHRRSLEYAVQITQTPTGGHPRVIKCISVSIDIAGGMPPPAIKAKLQEKVVNFIANAYPGQVGINAVITGRIDLKI